MLSPGKGGAAPVLPVCPIWAMPWVPYSRALVSMLRTHCSGGCTQNKPMLLARRGD